MSCLLFLHSVFVAKITAQYSGSYVFVNIAKSKADAATYCNNNYKTNLATILSTNDRTIAIDLMRSASTQRVWNGLIRGNDKWSWQDGTQCVSGGNSHFCTPDTSWWTNTGETDYCCGMIPTTGIFNDYDCSYDYAFLCNAPPTSSPTTDPTSTEPTFGPTINPSLIPTDNPSEDPTLTPSINPTVDPTVNPTKYPTLNPITNTPTSNPTSVPTFHLDIKTSRPTLTVETIYQTVETFVSVINMTEIASIINDDSNKKEYIFWRSSIGIVVIIIVIFVIISLLICGVCLIYKNKKLRKQMSLNEPLLASYNDDDIKYIQTNKVRNKGIDINTNNYKANNNDIKTKLLTVASLNNPKDDKLTDEGSIDFQNVNNGNKKYNINQITQTDHDRDSISSSSDNLGGTTLN